MQGFTQNATTCVLKSATTNPTVQMGTSSFHISKFGWDFHRLAFTDFGGYDILYYQGAFDTCPIACAALPGCIGYAIDYDTGKNCWMKSAFDASAFSYHPTRDIVLLKRYTPYVPEPTISYKDYTASYGVHLRVSFNACAAKCGLIAVPSNVKSVPTACIGFNFDRDNQGCWFYGSSSVGVEDLSKKTIAMNYNYNG